MSLDQEQVVHPGGVPGVHEGVQGRARRHQDGPGGARHRGPLCEEDVGAFTSTLLRSGNSILTILHFHYVIFGGTMFAIFGGIAYWFPKMFSTYFDSALGKVHFWLTFIFFNLAFFPMHIDTKY